MTSSISELKEWLEKNKISEVECIFPDMAGSSKGKILPVERFIKSIDENSLKLADSVFGQTVSGKWVYESEIIDYVEEDLHMVPDFSTIRKFLGIKSLQLKYCVIYITPQMNPLKLLQDKF